MTELQRLLAKIAHTEDCTIAPPRGLPRLRPSERLPTDLVELYSACGGITLFASAAYPVRIVSPQELVRSNLEIVGAECPDDISDRWYIVARGGPEEAISIDCDARRLGRCYDSFWDSHGVAGETPIIALSFTELLSRLLDGRGTHWYWLANDAMCYGDAYG
jgi:hypothetical protein